MGASGFPIDLVLFGMIAAFLVLRLRSILGKRTGFERPAPPVQQAPLRPTTGPIIEARADSGAPATAQTVPDATSATGQALARIQEIDRNFDASRFLAGADQAFRMIVAAFAEEVSCGAGADQHSILHLPNGLVVAVRLPTGQVLAVEQRHEALVIGCIAIRVDTLARLGHAIRPHPGGKPQDNPKTVVDEADRRIGVAQGAEIIWVDADTETGANHGLLTEAIRYAHPRREIPVPGVQAAIERHVVDAAEINVVVGGVIKIATEMVAVSEGINLITRPLGHRQF